LAYFSPLLVAVLLTTLAIIGFLFQLAEFQCSV